MPIRINLLAEAQAAEELRRKDPVKRAAYVAGFVVFLVVLWAGTLQCKIIAARSELNGLTSQWKDMEKNFKGAVDGQKKAMEIESKLAALHQLVTNRFLWGTALNALQQSIAGVEDVQLMRLKTEQVFAQGEGTPSRTNGATIIRGKPPTATEKITMIVEARDSGAQPGMRVGKFKEVIAGVPYFQENLQKTNGVLLTSHSGPQLNPATRSSFVQFTLQCNFPEKTR